MYIIHCIMYIIIHYTPYTNPYITPYAIPYISPYKIPYTTPDSLCTLYTIVRSCVTFFGKSALNTLRFFSALNFF